MVDKNKLNDSEIVRIPVKKLNSVEIIRSLTEWGEKNDDKMKWPIVDLRGSEIMGRSEILLILVKPDEK